MFDRPPGCRVNFNIYFNPACFVIGSENSCHSLNQSDATLKPFTTWPPAFSRSLGSVVGFNFSCHWLLKVFSILLVGRYD